MRRSDVAPGVAPRVKEDLPLSIIVQKYGGSSVASIDKIKAVAHKVANTVKAGHKVVVVVSAMGDTTDELLGLARQINPEPARRELDMLLSVGERISMALLSMAIHCEGHDAISFTGSQSGIITTASHSNARIIEVRPYRIQDELEVGRVVIVAGYQGVSYRREITTLGRGGSDTTAVALAAALGAEACEIYSDVDGVFSSDPRIVDDARKLEALTYEEMQEMARLGAKVLHAAAVEFARRAQIALYARSTHLQGSRGTPIHSGGDLRRVDGFADECARIERSLGVQAIAGIASALWLELRAEGEALDAFLARIEALETPLCEVTSQGARAMLKLDDIHDLEGLTAELTARFGPALTLRRDLGLISAVGTGVGDRPRAAREARAALDEAGIPVVLLQGSGHSLRGVIPADRVKDAMRALHAKLIDPA